MKKKDNVLFQKNVMAFVLMIIFFVAIIIVYYRMLSSATKERITRDCELSAVASSDWIDRYLAGGLDCINITEGSLNSMIREGRASEAILDYLVSQSKAVESILPEATTGLYGYINGEYLDGDGWVPDEGYDPLARPWYIGARANMGQIVVVDPYVDAQTGEIVTTLAKELCDAKSVVAVDMSLKELQNITEEITGENETVMVLDRDYSVISHSDRSEIQKDYSVDDGSLGSAIVKAYRASDGASFKTIYNKKEYIVYSQMLDNNWICLCATDTTQAYTALRIPLILTIVVSAIVIWFMIVYVMISDRRMRQTRELEEKTQIAIAANNAKTAFLANMSHEIRTPINAILGMNEMVIRESNEDDILKYSKNIKAAGKTLLGIVNDVLDLSRIEAGKIEITPNEYRLSAIVSDMVTMIKERADEKGLKLDLDVETDIPNGLYGDEMRIKQVITNLLSNAVKYTHSGTVALKMRHKDAPDDPESIVLEVSVEDTGAGIRPEDMDKLFNKFERLEEDKNRNIEGTGLGLSITEGLLELMGSSLQIQSEYGKGSVFSFAIVQKVIDRSSVKDQEIGPHNQADDEPQFVETFVAPDAEILIVDDNPMNLAVFISLVKRTLVKTDECESGAEAVEKAGKKRYDMIFLDHMMPEKDGIETLHEIRSDWDNPNNCTPVICLTANAIAGAREFYLEAGFDNYLTKPVDPVTLENMMIKYLPQEKVTRRMEDKKDRSDDDAIPAEFERLRGTAIDVASGMSNSGSGEAYLSLMSAFCDAASDRGDELNDLLEKEDYKNYTIKIHAMKSSLRLIGANDLSDRAQELENAGKNGEYDRILRGHEQFMSDYDGILKLLKPIFEREDAADDDRPMVDEEILMAIYEDMHAAAEDMDCDRLDDLVKELDRYCVPEDQKERIGTIRSAIKDYEYEKVAAALEDVIKRS